MNGEFIKLPKIELKIYNLDKFIEHNRQTFTIFFIRIFTHKKVHLQMLVLYLTFGGALQFLKCSFYKHFLTYGRR
mgnify:CR=1